MAALVDMEAYGRMSPQARGEFEQWVRHITGLEFGLSPILCFKVAIGERSIWTWHYLGGEGGVQSYETDELEYFNGECRRVRELYYYIQRFDLIEKRWDMTPTGILPEA